MINALLLAPSSVFNQTLHINNFRVYQGAGKSWISFQDFPVNVGYDMYACQI